uniref:MADS-box domain-containing protein n=1 Tax=Oryza punctata TaxID=4537 RepID=A0A0E0MLN5_ORYPU
MRPPGRTSKGRHHIEIRLIDTNDRRRVTFAKRRCGLFKKVAELALLIGASIAVVVFSETNRAYAFGDPSVDAVVLSYAPVPGEAAAAAPVHRGDGLGEDVDLEELRRAVEETSAEVAASRRRSCRRRPRGGSGGRSTWTRSGRLCSQSSPERSRSSGTTSTATPAAVEAAAVGDSRSHALFLQLHL